jgi:hypothetical protein
MLNQSKQRKESFTSQPSRIKLSLEKQVNNFVFDPKGVKYSQDNLFK